MTESEKFTLERFIKVNVEFYKYPDYTPVPLFEGFEVTEGPGPLDKKGTWGMSRLEEAGSWLTVKWKGVNDKKIRTCPYAGRPFRRLLSCALVFIRQNEILYEA